MSSYNEPCMTRRTLIDLNSIELNYYPFLISLDKCNGGYNADDDLSKKIYVLCNAKNINLKVFHMITRINEAKTLVKHILCDCKCKSDSTAYNSNH